MPWQREGSRRKRVRKKRPRWILAGLLLAAFGFGFHYLIASDIRLDHGGRWNYNLWESEGARTY